MLWFMAIVMSFVVGGGISMIGMFKIIELDNRVAGYVYTVLGIIVFISGIAISCTML